MPSSPTRRRNPQPYSNFGEEETGDALPFTCHDTSLVMPLSPRSPPSSRMSTSSSSRYFNDNSNGKGRKKEPQHQVRRLLAISCFLLVVTVCLLQVTAFARLFISHKSFHQHQHGHLHGKGSDKSNGERVISKDDKDNEGNDGVTLSVILPEIKKQRLFVEAPSIWSRLHQCTPEALQAQMCREAYRGSRPETWLKRTTCAFETSPQDIVFGVWHSLETEDRLMPLLDTWGMRTNIVLLASKRGVIDSRRFGLGKDGEHKAVLLDTGMEQDDYFSTLGKGFLGLKGMLDLYPTKKWFVVLGDDNYVLLEKYVSMLSAFDSDEEWTFSRMVWREKFKCKVAGGAGIITSRAMTRFLYPHLESFFLGIVERSGGNVNRAAEEDKYHDIAFQRLVEDLKHEVVHLEELLHNPPGTYFDPRTFKELTGPSIASPGIVHYVPGAYMSYLDFVSTQVCTCAVGGQRGRNVAGGAVTGGNGVNKAIADTVVGVRTANGKRPTRLDLRRIENTWGKEGRFVLVSGEGPGAWLMMLRALHDAFPDSPWYLLADVTHYVRFSNLFFRTTLLAGTGQVVVVAPDFWSRGNEEGVSGAGGDMLLNADLVKALLATEDNAAGAATLTDHQLSFSVVLSRKAPTARIIEDDGFAAHMLSSPSTIGSNVSNNGYDNANAGATATSSSVRQPSRCPAVIPMEPDLADLRPEFVFSEGSAVMAVTGYLLNANPQRVCTTRLLTEQSLKQLTD